MTETSIIEDLWLGEDLPVPCDSRAHRQMTQNDNAMWLVAFETGLPCQCVPLLRTFCDPCLEWAKQIERIRLSTCPTCSSSTWENGGMPRVLWYEPINTKGHNHD